MFAIIIKVLLYQAFINMFQIPIPHQQAKALEVHETSTQIYLGGSILTPTRARFPLPSPLKRILIWRKPKVSRRWQRQNRGIVVI